jgi:hypothetical protein
MRRADVPEKIFLREEGKGLVTSASERQENLAVTVWLGSSLEVAIAAHRIPGGPSPQPMRLEAPAGRAGPVAGGSSSATTTNLQKQNPRFATGVLGKEALAVTYSRMA